MGFQVAVEPATGSALTRSAEGQTFTATTAFITPVTHGEGGPFITTALAEVSSSHGSCIDGAVQTLGYGGVSKNAAEISISRSTGAATASSPATEV